VQTNANLVLIQQEIQQLQLAITGNGQQLDPVTCGQLTGLFYTLNVSLFQIAQAIAAAAGGGTTPVDLTAVVNALLELAAAAQSYPPVWNAIAAALGTQLGNIAAESHLSHDALADLVTAYYGRPRRSKIARAYLLGLVGMYGWTLWGAIQDGASPLEYDFWYWAMERFEGAALGLTASSFPHLLDEVQRDD